MSLKHFILPLFCSCLCTTEVISQTATTAYTPKIIPPSPNAASIAKFGDIPVSPYTGTTDISVPFYTIKTKSISVPVSIDYHTGGIRLADEAGLVGLGWALNTGGMISRSINDKDDFDPGYFNGSLVSTPDFPEVKGRLVSHNFSYEPQIFGVWGYGFKCNYQIYSDAGNTNYFSNMVYLNLYDMEPDTYNFNFPGGSGKFIIGRNGKVILQKQENLKIEYATGGSSFTITDDHGNKFFFVDKEYSQPASGGATHISAWLLSKIVTQQKDSVMYNYSTDNTWTLVTGITHETLRKGVGGFENPIYSNDPGQTYLNKTLQNIDWPNGQIQFDYDAIRTDLQNGKKLNTVRVYVKDQAGLHYQKENRLYYSYFNSTYTGSTEFLRLKLDSVKEVTGSITFPAYKFDYNQTNPMDQLSGKHYSSVDHWGYFNGRSNAISGDNTRGFSPDFVGIATISDISQYVNLPGANREPDFNYMQYFSLNKVTYPTGGYTALVYEPNYYDFDSSTGGPDGRDFVYVKTTSKDTIVTVTHNGTDTGSIDFSDIYLTSGFATNATITIAFRAASSDSLNKYHNVLGFGKINFTFNGNTTDISDTSLYCSGQMNGSNCSGTVYSFTMPLTISSPNKLHWSGYIAPQIKMSQGFMEIRVTVTYPQALYRTTTMMMAGGLRIKSITDYAASGTIAKKRTYDYGYQQDRNSDGTAESYSYGKLMGYVSYARQEPIEVSSGQFKQSLTRYSSSISGLTSLSSGNIVGYSQVTEYTSDPSNNDLGKTVYTFYNSPDTSFTYGGRRLPGTNNLPNNLNGVMRSKTLYKNVSNVYTKVQESNYYYHTANRVIYDCMKYSHISQYTDNNPGQVGTCHNDANGNPIPNLDACQCPAQLDSAMYNLLASFYPAISSEKVLLDSSVDRLYDQSDVNKVITTRSYNYYDNTKHYQLTRSKSLDSKANTHITFIKYPQDYISSGNYTGNTILDSLIGRNMVSEAIEKRDSLYYSGSSTGYISGAQLSVFRFLTSNVLGLDKQYELNIQAPVTNFQPFAISGNTTSQDSRYRQMISFDAYDSNYNILQYRTVNQSPSSFIWDYNKQFPVAQVINASNDQVAYTSFEADGKGNWNNFTGIITNVTAAPYPPTGTRYYNLTASTTLSKASLTSGKKYIISYWSSNATAYSITGVSANTSVKGKTIGNWTYYEHTVTASATTITISGTGAIDEVRLYPSDAQMTSYSYEPQVGITSACDVNNRITYYTYDENGRLSYISDQDKFILKKFCYNYAGQPVACDTKLTIASPDITLSLVNTAQVSGFTAAFTDVNNSSNVYTFSLPSTSGVISPTIPAGTYNLSLSKRFNTTTYYYSLNCGFYTSGTSGSFSNVNVTTGNCTIIYIDTINQQ